MKSLSMMERILSAISLLCLYRVAAMCGTEHTSGSPVVIVISSVIVHWQLKPGALGSILGNCCF